MKKKKPLSIYIHIPFCRKRCGYCDFNTYSGYEKFTDEYVDCLLKEIIFYSSRLAKEFDIHTIYFGGGTPTILPANQISKIIEKLQQDFSFSDQPEISCEANPTELKIDYLQRLHQAGMNRLSIGMQSAILSELKVLGRTHIQEDVNQTFMNASFAGFTNINLDLIYGIPGQTMDSFIESVNTAVALEPQHISLYSLSLNPVTPLAKMIEQNKIPPIDKDLSGDMYAWLMDELPGCGYDQYEIANWSLSGGGQDFRCVHNLQYWKNKDYLGLGAGAHSFIIDKRWNNLAPIEDYIETAKHNKTQSESDFGTTEKSIKLSKMDIIKETIMMGLRLTSEGLSIEQFSHRFRIDFFKIYAEQIERNHTLGLIEIIDKEHDQLIRLTKKGRMFGNLVFQDFI